MDDVQTFSVCGVPIAVLDPHEAAATIVAAGRARRRFEVHLCNAYTLSLVDSDRRLAQVLSRADLNLPDGSPVAWLGRKHGLRGPVRGPGLVRDVVRQGAPAGLNHYFYGGDVGVAAAVAEKLKHEEPPALIAGTHTPRFGEPTSDELDQVAREIRSSGADVVWIGLGTPRQDYVAKLLAERVDAVLVPVGAAFDFISGRIQEAPTALHGSGFEWLYRLSREPRRLWARYALGNPRFMASVIRHRRRT